MKTKNACAIAAVAALAGSACGSLTLDTLNTSNGQRLGNTSVLLQNVTADQTGWTGPALDLRVDLTFPNTNPNSRTTPNGSSTNIGLGTGGNPFFQSYTGADPDGDGTRGGAREPFVYTYSFFESGTNNAFTVADLSVGFTDFDNDRSNFIGREVLVALGADSVVTASGVDATLNDLSNPADIGRGQQIAGRADIEADPTAVRLDPNLSTNGSPINSAVVNFSQTDSFEMIFMNEGFNTGNGGAGLVGGGFGFTGGAEINFGSLETSTTVVPAPGSLALLGLGGLAAMRRRR